MQRYVRHQEHRFDAVVELAVHSGQLILIFEIGHAPDTADNGGRAQRIGEIHQQRVEADDAPAWDSKRKGRETLFERHAKGELRMVWMTAQEASSSRWSKLSAHKSFAKTGKDMLLKELSAIKAAIVGTDLAEELSELKRKIN